MTEEEKEIEWEYKKTKGTVGIIIIIFVIISAIFGWG